MKSGYALTPATAHGMSLTPPRTNGHRGTVGFTISIDTEEDNWVPVSHGITTSNIGQLPKLSSFFLRLGVRATYFTTYQVAVDRTAAGFVRDVKAAGAAEIAAHLHPWNTPPICGLEPAAQMLASYPVDIQQRKVEQLIQALRENLGTMPASFRTGRFGVGQATIRALVESGIFIDSSVTPLLSWREAEGPSFIDAPLHVYRLNGHGDVITPTGSGPVIEVPITVGYTRFRPSTWNRISRFLDTAAARHLHLGGVARVSGLVGRVTLSPETHSASEMLRISRILIENGAPHLHMYFHSSTLSAGLTPFARTQADVLEIYDRMERYVEGLVKIGTVHYCTVSEAARLYAPVPAAEPAP